jgi:PAS domain S-box-containing protein
MDVSASESVVRDDLEISLRRSQERFHALGRATGSIVWTTPPTGREGEAPEWYPTTGQSREDCSGWGWLEAVHPDDRQRTEQAWTDALKRAGPYIIDYRLRTCDGAYRWQRTRGVPVFEDGDISEWVGLIEDIHDQVTFEHERDRFFTVGVDMLLVAGFDGYFKRASPKWTELFGWSHEEMLAKPWIDFVHPDDREACLEVRNRLFAGQDSDFENRYRAKDGSFRWISWRVRPFLDEGLLYGAATDVTARKVADQALRESEERYRATFDNAAVGIAHVGLDGRWLRFNDALCRFLGYAREELLGMTFGDVTHPDDLEANWAQAKALAAGAADTFSMEKRYIRKDGSVVWGHLTVSMLFDSFGQPQNYISVVEDISRQKLVEAELERLVADRTAELQAANEALMVARDAALAGSRAKSEFLANMSHEVRTPMNGVIGITSLLLESDLDPDTREMVETIALSGSTLLRVIDDILDFSQIEAGKLTIELVPTDIDELARGVMALFEGRARAADVALVTTAPKLPLPKVRADPVRLRQILSNLVSNGLKFTERGAVEMAWRWSSDGDAVRVEFAIRDTGVGIPPDRQTAIFESFTQADGSTRRRFGGTGLGLTICKRLAELMGGGISLESEPGRGTTFRVDLPFEFAAP